jgi:hypothetical protein
MFVTLRFLYPMVITLYNNFFQHTPKMRELHFVCDFT